ncbi:MAG: hypothetical protein OJF50_005534 [Nitrospira sp.]|nr:hypothetical protein [Nitrospira sp.]
MVCLVEVLCDVPSRLLEESYTFSPSEQAWIRKRRGAELTVLPATCGRLHARMFKLQTEISRSGRASSVSGRDRIRLCVIGLAFSVSVILNSAGDAFAEGESSSPTERLAHLALRLKETEQAVEKRLLSKSLDLHFYGYLDGSYTQNFNNPSNKINQLRIFDVNSNQFRPNLAQFVLDRKAKAGNGIDRFGFRLKTNVGRDSAFVGGTNLSELNQWADFQEFYLQYLVPQGNGIDVKVGQMNALIGYETIESPYNANYSRSWLFGLGQPFTTRGIRVSYRFNDRVWAAVGVINRINGNLLTNTTTPWIEASVTFVPSDRVKLTLYGFTGPGIGSNKVSWGANLFGGGLLSVQATTRMSVVLEGFYASIANSSLVQPGTHERWGGVAGYLIYDFSERWGIRFRSEIFEDSGGFFSCRGTTAYQPQANVCFGATPTTPAPPESQTLWETTTTFQFKPVSWLITRLEYRYDKSDHNVFQIGERAASYQSTLSLEAIYLF